MAATLVVVISAAQAAPQKKVFNATVDVQNVSTLADDSARLRLTLRNDASSNQTLGSANFIAPDGIEIESVPAGTPASRSGWTVETEGTNLLKFRSTSGALIPSSDPSLSNVYADVNVTIDATTCTDATWRVFAKQSNDFSGSGNDFAAGTTSNRRPLGSFTIDAIETVVNPGPDELHVPQILTNTDEDVHVTPYDICGDVYSNYGTSVGRATEFVANPAVPPRLVGAGNLSINWATGLATLNPKVVETGDFLTISDSLSTPGESIKADSNVFDVVEKLCTELDTNCQWQGKQGKITVTAGAPPAGSSSTPSLGIGFYGGELGYTCGGKTTRLGDTLININPRDYPDTAPTITVTLTYDKSLSGNGPASAFNVCLMKDYGAWGDFYGLPGPGDAVQACPSSAPSSNAAPCILDRKRVTGGALQIVLFLKSEDPWGGVS